MSVPNRANDPRRQGQWFKPATARASSLNIVNRSSIAVNSSGTAEKSISSVLLPGPKYGDAAKAEYDQIIYRKRK